VASGLCGLGRASGRRIKITQGLHGEQLHQNLSFAIPPSSCCQAENLPHVTAIAAQTQGRLSTLPSAFVSVTDPLPGPVSPVHLCSPSAYSPPTPKTHKMASKAIPSHLKPSAAAGGQGDGDFTQRHHGKSQSHVVSSCFCSLRLPPLSLRLWPSW